MKQRNKKSAGNQSDKRYRWPLLAGLATVLIAIGAITVISRQSGASAKAKPVSPTAQAGNNKKYVTVKVAGRDVQVDPQSGQLRPMSPEEARELSDNLKTMLNKSSEGLAEEYHADGTVSMDLQGRFQNVAVARVESDGTVTQSCIDQPQQAASFFGIEPSLMGVKSKQTRSAQQPVQRTPAKKARQ